MSVALVEGIAQSLACVSQVGEESLSAALLTLPHEQSFGTWLLISQLRPEQPREGPSLEEARRLHPTRAVARTVALWLERHPRASLALVHVVAPRWGPRPELLAAALPLSQICRVSRTSNIL